MSDYCSYRRMGVAVSSAYFDPIQLRGPTENGIKASLTSSSKRWSYRGSESGRKRSGWNPCGSTQSVDVVWIFCKLTPIMV